MRRESPAMNQNPGFRVSKGNPGLNPLKITALAYLREARINEAYETMDEIIRYATEFGADRQEVAAALEAAR